MNVYQKVLAVMAESKSVAKTGYNSFHKYKYATEADYISAVRPLLIKHGLTVTATEKSNFKEGDITTVTMEFNVVNSEKPEDRYSVVVSGTGQDKGDKGLYKAITGAKKYFVSTNFFIETGDDAEKDDTVPVQTATTTVTLSAPVAAEVSKKPVSSFRKLNNAPAKTEGEVSY